MKILVPTDFSDNAKHAFEFAKKVAKLNMGTITLLFSYYTIYDFAAQAAKIVHEIETFANKAMEDQINSRHNFGITVDHKIIQGTVATAVTSTAYKEDYDLIIMGTQGASGIEKSLIGSNTADVIKDSKVPVLAVPFEASFETLNEITMAVELTGEEGHFFDQLMHLTKNWEMSYRALHIQKEHHVEKETIFKELEVYLKENYSHTPFSSTSFSAEDTIEGINQYLNEAPGSLLVMFSKNKSFLEYLFNSSHVVKMAYHTHVPLLVFKS
ncbi:MAG: universal stress protein [Anditalea sp.]